MDSAAFQNIWWVFALPIFGFLIQALTGKIILDNLGTKLGRRVLGTLACLPIFVSFFLAIDITMKLASQPPESRTAILTLFEWITTQSLSVPFEFRVDTLSMTMTLIITGIGAFIHLYATGYMSEEKDYPRFFTYLNLFIACMLVLVLGNNLALLFIGWEGVGVCSYLLIGFWYKDLANSKAANKAFIVNRIGDYGLTLGMFLLVYVLAGSISPMAGGSDARWLSYDVILDSGMLDVFRANPGITTAIALLLFVGAMGKSAQFPIYIWLPDAMAGPTPVSALIHAATMVTSGVFLLNRMSPVMDLSGPAMGVIALIGAVTSLVAALIAFGQSDIKKVLAFSTVSQLGYMFIACGVGAYWAGLFHVTTHAFFKALLFLGSGAVIHAMSHNQDMRNYGNLAKYIKITTVTMLIGWLAIAGVPGLAGFFSKEAALGAAVNSSVSLYGIPAAQIAGWVGFLVAALTAAYMTRMTMLTFYSGPERWKTAEATHHTHDDHGHHHADHGHHDHADHGPDTHQFFYTDEEMALRAAKEPHEHHHDLEPTHVPHEVPPSMWVPLVVLAIASVVGGYLLNSVYPLKLWLYPGLAGVEEPYGIPHLVLVGVSVLAAGTGIVWGLMVYGKKLPESEGFDLSKWSPFRRSAERQFGYDALLSEGSIRLGDVLGRGLAAFDRGVIDGLVRAVGGITKIFGGLFRRSQTGYVRAYALLMQVGVVALLAYFVFTMMRNGGGL